jgi:hypothetical protein
MFAMTYSDLIRVWVHVPQDAAFGVKPGVEAVIRVPAMPNLTFHGKVARIADALQPGTRTLLTEVDVSNPDWRAAAGGLLHRWTENPTPIAGADRADFGDHLQSERHAGRGGQKRRRASAQNRPITADYGTEVEVNSGINDGDQVILQRPVNLTDGDKVQITPETPQSAPWPSWIGLHESGDQKKVMANTMQPLTAALRDVPLRPATQVPAHHTALSKRPHCRARGYRRNLGRAGFGCG